MLEANSTRFPLLLDILPPPSRTIPWLMSEEKGSVKSIIPMSKRNFVMKRA